MADEAEPSAAVVIRVIRSGGIAGIARAWRVESDEPDDWAPLVDACPWGEAPETGSGGDRFVWRLEVAHPRPRREAVLSDSAVEGPWRRLVERVREEGASDG